MTRQWIIENIDEGTAKAKFHNGYVEILLCGAEFGLYEMVVSTDDFKDMDMEIDFDVFEHVFSTVFDDLDSACFPDDEETAVYWLNKWKAFESDIEFNTWNMNSNEQLRELFEKNFK